MRIEILPTLFLDFSPIFSLDLLILYFLSKRHNLCRIKASVLGISVSFGYLERRVIFDFLEGSVWRWGFFYGNEVYLNNRCEERKKY